jgi:hypothetical protein
LVVPSVCYISILTQVHPEAAEEDDDAMSWIDKSRKLEAEKALAQQRARMMEELDEEQETTKDDYSSKSLTGMKIAHDAEQFGENEEILVLKDTYIVDKDGTRHFNAANILFFFSKEFCRNE